MAIRLAKAGRGRIDTNEIVGLRDILVEEKQRLDRVLRRVEDILRRSQPTEELNEVPAGRTSPLDNVKNVIGATKDLRLPNGNLSAGRVAKLYGISLSQLAGWLGRTKQALSKTPDADSLQNALGYFERVARLRAVTGSDAEFRKWLRMPNDALANRTPLGLMEAGQWQEMADKVDDMLTGMPT